MNKERLMSAYYEAKESGRGEQFKYGLTEREYEVVLINEIQDAELANQYHQNVKNNIYFYGFLLIVAYFIVIGVLPIVIEEMTK